MLTIDFKTLRRGVVTSTLNPMRKNPLPPQPANPQMREQAPLSPHNRNLLHRLCDAEARAYSSSKPTSPQSP